MIPFEGQSLRQFVKDEVPTAEIETGDAAPYSDGIFKAEPHGHARWKDHKESELGGYFEPITNFVAWARSEVVFPENSELNYAEVMVRDSRGRVHGPREIPLRKFNRPDEWTISEFGIWCRIYPRVQRDVLLNAIQVATGTPPRHTAYDRLGLVSINEGEHRFLAGNGALGPEGLDTSIQVRAGDALEAYEFTDAENPEDLRLAVASVFQMLDVANTQRGVTAIVTLLAAAFRAPLMVARSLRFSIALIGETNAGKSGLASMVMNLFGPTFAVDRLPGNWISSSKSTIDLISRVSSVMLVLDDYVEQSGAMAARQSNARETINRLIGNGAKRDVLNRDQSRRDGREPAAMVVSTQESIGSNRPPSETSRQLIITIERRIGSSPDISIDSMIRVQEHYGATGMFSKAMTGFVVRALSNLDHAEERLKTEYENALVQMKEIFSDNQVFERTGRNVAELMVGWNELLSFADSLGVFEHDVPYTLDALRKIGNEAFVDLVRAQAAEQDIEQPETVVLDLLREVLSARKASLRDRETGGQPSNPEMFGWSDRRIVSYSTGTQIEYSPAQNQIGWVDDEYVYLQPKMTYQALEDLAKKSGTTLPVGERSLGVTLQRSGISEPGHGNRASRKEYVGSGGKVWVLKIHRRHIFEEGISTDAYEDNEGNVIEIRRSA